MGRRKRDRATEREGTGGGKNKEVTGKEKGAIRHTQLSIYFAAAVGKNCDFSHLIKLILMIYRSKAMVFPGFQQ